MSRPAPVAWLVSAVVVLWGCAGAPLRGPSWRVYVRDEPVAVVSVDSESGVVGSVVDVKVHAEAAEVTLWRRGPATLEPLRHEVAGLPLRFGEKDVAEVAPLGRALAAGRYADVEAALDGASATRRDDLAVGLLATTPDGALAAVRQSAQGRRLVVRLFDELTSGRVGDEEERQASRVLRLLAQRWGPEGFVQVAAGGKLKSFPFRKLGVTAADSASPTVSRGAQGGIDVRYPSRVARYPEGLWLATAPVHLEEDELVAVRLYDEGGVVLFVPALFLFQLANAEDVAMALKALGLSSKERAAAEAVRRETETLLGQVEEVERLADVIPITRGQKPPTPPSAPAQPVVRFEEEVLRATGTEGRLVRIRQEGEGNLRLTASNKPESLERAEAAGQPRPPAERSAAAERAVEGDALRRTVAAKGPVAGGGAAVENIQAADAARIQNAANRIGKPIHVVGSRASGNAGPNSDWDFVIEANHHTRSSVAGSLPGAKSVQEGLPRNQDLFKGPLDRSKPYVTFFPE